MSMYGQVSSGTVGFLNTVFRLFDMIHYPDVRSKQTSVMDQLVSHDHDEEVMPHFMSPQPTVDAARDVIGDPK